MKKLNDGISAIKPSQTLAIASLAKQMVEQGHNVCNFSAGEPDFDTPDLIKQAAIDALNQGKTKYTPVAGVPKLCQALSEKFKRDNNLDYKPSQIIVSCGGKHSLALVFQTLLNPGDEVMIPAPYWLSYPEMVRVAGGKPVFIHTTADQDFKITPQHIERLATPQTKALVINSPSNPTGVMYTPAELHALGEAALKHDIAIVSDEIYEKMVYDGNTQVSMASFSKEFYGNTITVNGFSKTYSMTGWRLGYTAGPETFIKAMNALQSHCASAPNTFAQWGAIAALEKGEASVSEMVAAFDARRRRIFELMAAIPGVKCVKPTGAFYVFPDIASFGLDSLAFSKRLLEEEHVAVVPGVAFGADDCVRLSYACSMTEIEDGMTRLARFCAKL
jgi:aspartate aminotransferase